MSSHFQKVKLLHAYRKKVEDAGIKQVKSMDDIIKLVKIGVELLRNNKFPIKRKE